MQAFVVRRISQLIALPHPAFFLVFPQIWLSHKINLLDLILRLDTGDPDAPARNGTDCHIGDILPSPLKLICRQICDLI